MTHILIRSLALLVLNVCLLPFGFTQQNLVDNPSFENNYLCPNSLSDIFHAYWRLPQLHSGSSDYFHACATSTACDVPNNVFGSALAAQGDAYAGGYLGLSSGGYREYICDTLIQPLVAGSKYVVSFQYRAASNARFASDDMGFYLSVLIPSQVGTGALGVTPTSQNTSGNYLTNNATWQTYADTIQASGGEQFITIGSFSVSPSVTLYNTSASINGAYMYWDDVHVELLEGIDGDTNICEGDTAKLWSLELDSVVWFDSVAPTTPIDTADTIWVSPATTTTYMAISAIDTYYFTVNVFAPIYGFLGNDTTICEGETVTRVVDLPGYSFLWSDNETDSALITQDSGDFWVEVDIHGCTSYDTFHIALFPFPEYDLGPDQTICWYDSITLDPNVTGGSVFYNWSNGSTDPTITVQNPGTYWVDLTNTYCTMRDSIDIGHHPTVIVDLGPDKEFCYSPFEPIVPNAVNATSFLWSTGATSGSVNVTTTGTYFVTATGNGCNAYDSVNYTFYHDPFFNLPETLMYCKDDTVELSTGLNPSGHSFIWNTGASAPTIQIHGGSMGSYWVQAADSNCSMRDTVYVGMHPPMNLELGDDIPACVGDAVEIAVNTDPSLNYSWSNGASTQNITITQSGVFTLTVSDGNCTETDKIRVFFFEYPPVDLGGDTILCEPSELRFDLSSAWPAVNFHWYDGTTTPKHIMYAEKDQTIWVKATNVVCTTEDVINITIADRPVIALKDDTIKCENTAAKVRVEGDPSWSYTWSTGDTNQIFITQMAGTYTVTVYDGTCASIEEIIVYDMIKPMVEIDAPEYICFGEEVELEVSVNDAYFYRWQDGSNRPTFMAIEPGIYSVEVYHACGIATDTVQIEDCECYVRFPSAFRPTPAGINKTFGPVVDCDLISFKMTIFNRWGQAIYYTEDYHVQWDGKVNGQLAPVGTYGWKAEYKGMYNGQRVLREEQGTVTLVK